MTEVAAFLKALIQFAPEIADVVRTFAGVHGIDLGPVPPDMKKDAAAVDREIDAALAAKKESPPFR